MIMKYFFVISTFLATFFCSNLQAQKYQLSSSEVSFFSEAPMENIEAFNEETKSIFDESSREIAFIVPIESFIFDKSLMQEHFNENYLESDKYPDARFEGKLVNYDPNKEGEQQVRAKGTLTIHGVSQQVDVPGTVSRDSSGIDMEANFPVKVADYDIEIPKVVFYNIAEEVEIRVKLQYQPYES